MRNLLCTNKALAISVRERWPAVRRINSRVFYVFLLQFASEKRSVINSHTVITSSAVIYNRAQIGPHAVDVRRSSIQKVRVFGPIPSSGRRVQLSPERRNELSFLIPGQFPPFTCLPPRPATSTTEPSHCSGYCALHNTACCSNRKAI
jgi:hypothetical protein